MTELIKVFRNDIISIEESRNAKLFKQANSDLQEIYKFHISAKNSFTMAEHYLKNLYRSFNYAASIVSAAVKRKSFGSDEIGLLDECMDVMLTCCDKVIAIISK